MNETLANTTKKHIDCKVAKSSITAICDLQKTSTSTTEEHNGYYKVVKLEIREEKVVLLNVMLIKLQQVAKGTQ